MNNLTKFLESLSNQKLTLSSRAGSPTIKSTQRNQIKKDIEQVFLKDLREVLKDSNFNTVVEKTEHGVILGLEHDNLLNVKNASGEIAFEINIKVKNLDYDIVNEKINYEFEQEQKELRKKEKDENKKRKIKRDAIIREQKRLAKEKQRATE